MSVTDETELAETTCSLSDTENFDTSVSHFKCVCACVCVSSLLLSATHFRMYIVC